MSADELRNLEEAILNGNKETAIQAVEKAIANEIATEEILKHATKAIQLVGEKFALMELFLSDMMHSAEVMKAVFKLLRPHLLQEDAQTDKGTVVIGTVKGDIHDIGKNIVVAMLEGAGFKVYDIGVDVPPMTFVEKAEEVKADVIAVSSLLSTTMPYQRDIIRFLEDLGKRSHYKVIVGGAPVTAEWANKIGADSYAENAMKAIEKVTHLLT
jgi:corrinoid protein of di/trimethylamine methyltransferase